MENRIESLLDQVGLNWKIRTESIQTQSGIVLPNIAIIREDNNRVLGVHSNGYTPYQNEQLLTLIDRVSGLTGLSIHRGGHFNEGSKVYIQLKSNDLKLGNDRIEGYITGINSFDGSTSLCFGPSNITISCQNSFFGAYRTIDTKVRHTKNMEFKIEEVCRRIEAALVEEKQMFDHIVKMSEVPLTEMIKQRIIKKLFDVKQGDISTNTKNKIANFEADLMGEIAQKGNTLWGGFSGVTKYTTHTLYNGNHNKALENKMVGAYGERERNIFTELTSVY